MLKVMTFGCCLVMGACETASSVAVTDLDASGQVLRTTTELTYADIRNVSGSVVDKIFLDDGFLQRAQRAGFEYGEIPVAVRYVNNYTASDRISTEQFLSIIEEHLLNSQAALLYTADSPDWYYALDADLSDTRQMSASGSAQTIYKLTVTMTSIDNQKIGIWSEDIALTR